MILAKTNLVKDAKCINKALTEALQVEFYAIAKGVWLTQDEDLVFPSSGLEIINFHRDYVTAKVDGEDCKIKPSDFGQSEIQFKV